MTPETIYRHWIGAGLTWHAEAIWMAKVQAFVKVVTSPAEAEARLRRVLVDAAEDIAAIHLAAVNRSPEIPLETHVEALAKRCADAEARIKAAIA